MSKWVAIKENQRGKSVITIRRWVTINGKKKLERLPIRKYKHFRDNPEEVKQYLLRLNAAGREKVLLKHAFISPALQDEYRDLLCTQQSNQISARNEFNYVKNYFLNFFIGKENMSDPLNWHSVQKTKWAQFLLSDHSPKSMSAKLQVVHAVNKFMKWLHEKRPTEVPLLKFEPFEKARIKELRYNEKRRETHLMTESHYKLFLNKIDPRIKPIVHLCYEFGLRRSEAMGLSLNDVRKGHLMVERQLLKIDVYGPPKGRKSRKIPYWGMDAEKTYQWIEKLPKMNPRTFSTLWDKAIDAVKEENGFSIDYNPHDLRHTWITRMIRLHAPRDVQMAAGHEDINTTMGYLKDDRDLSNELFTPKAG